jgi:hypothetical protein
VHAHVEDRVTCTYNGHAVAHVRYPRGAQRLVLLHPQDSFHDHPRIARGVQLSGLPWVRLDTAFPSNPKVIALLQEREGHRAAFVYLCSLAYAGSHGTDGVIAVGALPFIHGRRSDAERLVRCRLWHDYPDGGWLINGWDEKQVTDEAGRIRRDIAKKAAAVRWGKESSGAG